MSSVLVVDDDRQVLEQIREILGGEGYQVAFIPKGEFLFQRLEQESYDLLLLDINLPGTNGLALLESVRSHDQFKDLPVIMITSEDERTTLSECFEKGANDYIRKPINEDALKSRVKSAIGASLYFQHELRIEKQKTLQSKMMRLSAQMNPHFIFNSLEAVQNFVLENETTEAAEFLSEFAGLMRSNLENSSNRYISLSTEIAFLTRYIDLEVKRFKHAFSYDLDIQVEDPENTMIPPMLLQPYIENAINHGLAPLHTPGKLIIRIRELNDQIECTIIDNGIGRKSAAGNKKSGYKSVAMSNIEARLEILNADLDEPEFHVQVTDLVENGKPAGTSISVIFPADLH